MHSIPSPARRATLAALTFAITPAFAGETTTVTEPASNGNWCNWLQENPATLYKNKKHPYIQEFRINGRFQWQYGYVNGRSGTRNLNYDTEEIRRFRLGFKLKFLQHLTLGTSFDLENDLAPTGRETDHDIEYADIYSATLSFNAQKAFDLSTIDSLKISLGKHKISSSAEYAVSSRHIKTIERSAISNYITPPSSTGLAITIDKGPWDIDLGVFSGDSEAEFSKFTDANDYFYTLRLGRSFNDIECVDKARIDLRLTMNGDEQENASNNPASAGAYNLDWAASIGTSMQKNRFTLLTDLIYGENGDEFSASGKRRPTREGAFWAVVILPSYMIIEDRLEAVFRYQYAHASMAEGIRLNSRYARRAGGVRGIPAVSNGRGDEHHSAYLGLNYYICGENAKIMAGVEYDDLSSASREIYQGYTAWAAFRMYF